MSSPSAAILICHYCSRWSTTTRKAVWGQDRRSRCSRLLAADADATLAAMITLSEVEAVVPQFSAQELAELEQLVRHARLKKTPGRGRSALDLPPLDLGRMPRPLDTRAEWYDEMLEGRV